MKGLVGKEREVGGFFFVSDSLYFLLTYCEFTSFDHDDDGIEKI